MSSLTTIGTTSLPGISSTGNLLVSTNTGNFTWNPYQNLYSSQIQGPLEKLSYYIYFELDKDDILSKNIRGIRKNKMIFNCDLINNRIQPYEFIMSLIEEKKEFSVKIKVSDILTINYQKLKFISIENNLNFNQDCDFSKLKVKFIYENVTYENHKLSKKQLRTDKIKKITKNNEV